MEIEDDTGVLKFKICELIFNFYVLFSNLLKIMSFPQDRGIVGICLNEMKASSQQAHATGERHLYRVRTWYKVSSNEPSSSSKSPLF